MNPAVDAYIEQSDKWPEEMKALRPILLGAGLTEEIKWRQPCYSHEGKNVAILQEMNDFLSLMFLKGALLEDPDGVLEEQGKNTRSARRIRFTSVEDVDRLSDTVKAYLEEAIEVEEAGLEVGPAPEPELVEELQTRLDQDPELEEASNRSHQVGVGNTTSISRMPNRPRPDVLGSISTHRRSSPVKVCATAEVGCQSAEVD